MKTELHIEIGPDGHVTIDVEGAEGRKCLDLTAPFEQAIGAVAKRDLKPSYYQKQAATLKNRSR